MPYLRPTPGLWPRPARPPLLLPGGGPNVEGMAFKGIYELIASARESEFLASGWVQGRRPAVSDAALVLGAARNAAWAEYEQQQREAAEHE
jgi:hypothetical protein